MCGISGLINEIRFQKSSYLELLGNSISRRGPDDAGSWTTAIGDIEIALLHSRLSIIDTSTDAHQPMGDAATDWIIIFNGEIYNYLEIREELRDRGWLFHSRSDTEVLQKAWAQWGIDSLKRLNGMFAFAVVHQVTGEMWLVRDRFGVKPLLWGRLSGGGLVFSSSVAAVAECLQASVDANYCAHGLRYKAFESHQGGAPFTGVESVPPGGWLKVKITRAGIVVSQGQWYSLVDAVVRKSVEIESCSDDELVRQCEQVLLDAVKIRLRSDVPLAVSLSGGLDSSTVAAFAARQVDGLHGFTYGAAEAASSEGPVVAQFASAVGVTPHFVWPEFDGKGLDALLERTLTWQEAPFPELSVMAQNEVFRTVRQAGFKVLLGGQGGDETFAGYRKFFVIAVRQAIRLRKLGEALPLMYSLGLMLLNEAGNARLYWQALARYRSTTDFSFRLLNWTPPTADLWGGPATTLSGRQIDDVQRWSIPTLLRYEDRNSMGHGVETRLPFMDYRLVELALALPVRLKIAHGFGKWAVRKVAHSAVPDFIRLNRKKRGFDVTQSWIANGLGASLRARIYDNRTTLVQYLKTGSNLNEHLTDAALQFDSNLLDEALMLAWLAQPVRLPSASGALA